MDLIDALRVARKLGLPVEHYNGKGEYKIRLPGRLLTIDNKRRDAPRILTSVLKQLLDST